MTDETTGAAAPATDSPVIAATATAAPATEASTTSVETTTTEQGTADTTAADTETKTETTPDPKANDWASVRTRIANGDEKVEKRLARYSSVESLAEALLAAQNKITSGGLKAPLPADATAEQLAEWRTDNGIPADPKEYDLSLPDGLVIGDADKPVVDDFLSAAHASNLTPAQVKSNLAWYFAQQEKNIEAQTHADIEAREKGEEALREVWGPEAKLNKGLINSLIATAPAGVSDLLLGARLSDGTPLGSHPDTLRWLADVARQVNPVATVVPGAGTNAVQAIEAELISIEKMMGDKTSSYWKGPEANKIQDRYRKLLDAKQRAG